MPSFAGRDGVKINYEVLGDGPVIVFLHGSLMEGRAWGLAGYVDMLASDFTCITLDGRGAGSSDKPHDPSAYATERYVADILGAAYQVGADSFAVVGYSYGTGGAWRVAHLHPEQVAGLVAIGGWHPNLYSFDPDVMERTRVEPMRRRGVRGTSDLMEREEGPLPAWWHEQVIASDPEAYIAQRYAAVEWTKVPPAEIQVPVLLVSGGKEDHEHDSELVAAALSDGRAVIVEGAGHCHNFLDPTTLAETKNFLGKLFD